MKFDLKCENQIILSRVSDFLFFKSEEIEIIFNLQIKDLDPSITLEVHFLSNDIKQETKLCDEITLFTKENFIIKEEKPKEINKFLKEYKLFNGSENELILKIKGENYKFINEGNSVPKEIYSGIYKFN